MYDFFSLSDYVFDILFYSKCYQVCWLCCWCLFFSFFTAYGSVGIDFVTPAYYLLLLRTFASSLYQTVNVLISYDFVDSGLLDNQRIVHAICLHCLSKGKNPILGKTEIWYVSCRVLTIVQVSHLKTDIDAMEFFFVLILICVLLWWFFIYADAISSWILIVLCCWLFVCCCFFGREISRS